MDTRKDYVARIQSYYERSDEKPRVQRLLKHLLRGRRYKKALDVGAGPGELSAVLSEHCDELVLVEIEEDFAKRLVTRFPKAKVVHGSLSDISPDEKFDLILMSHVLYYVPEKEWMEVLQRLLHQLNPGGWLVLIQNVDKGDWWETICHFKPKLGAHSAFYNRPWTSFKEEISKVAQLLETKSYEYQVSYKNLEDLVEFVGRSCLAIHNEAVRDKFLTEIKAFCEKQWKASGAPGVLKYQSEMVVLSPR